MGGRRWDQDSPESWNVYVLREEGAGSPDSWGYGRRRLGTRIPGSGCWRALGTLVPGSRGSEDRGTSLQVLGSRDFWVCGRRRLGPEAGGR